VRAVAVCYCREVRSLMIADILERRPATSIDDVMRIMTDIDQRLPDTDGLKWFNRLYLRVTEEVRTAVGTGAAFQDPVFLQRLDINFGNLYFDAAAAAERDPRLAPPAWRPLFQARQAPKIARIQFALAGMNAHINRDLPDGIASTFTALGGTPDNVGPRHSDFERVNAILESVETRIKGEFATGVIGDVDVIAGRLDDIFAMWSVRAARDAAWTHAEVLTKLGGTPQLRTSFFSSLDSFTGFAGRGLLLPVA
jgi:hypothetical protein